jgi:hypothetical protein
MLQDELFSEELARNPDFAHLARGRPRTVGGIPVSPATRHLQQQPGSHRQQQQHAPQVNIMETISTLGDQAKRNLQLLAMKFQQQRQNMTASLHPNNQAAAAGSSGANSSGSPNAAERRGLLEDNDDLELAARKDL